MSKEKYHVLFWGELIPATVTGVSISSAAILKILRERNHKIYVVEEYLWNLKFFKRLLSYLKNFFKLISCFFRFKYKYFYFMLPSSRMGLYKTFFLLPFLKAIQPSVIFTAHVHRGDTDIFYHQSSFNRFLLKFIFRFTDRLIALSPAFKENLHSIGFRKSIIFLRNTSNLEGFNSIAKENYTQRFISLTNYIKTKGITDLVKCFSEKELSHLKLDIFGSVYEDETHTEILKIKSPNINAHAPVSREKLPAAIAKYDALIVSSWNEGQPTVILEAMSLGIPVISSDVGDIRNMLGENYPFIFPAKNIEQMKSKIMEFHNYIDKNEISKLLKERYYQLFSNDIYRAEVVKIFS